MNILLTNILNGRAGGGNPTFNPALYPFSLAMFDADSRTANMGGRVNNAGTLSLTVGMQSVSMTALVQSMAGNPFLMREGFQYAIGGSTTRAHEERDKTTSIATTGNPAFLDTGIANFDERFATNSDGVATPITQAGKHIFSASAGVNDGTGTAAAFYNTPSAAWQTIRVISRIADAYGAAGKLWYLGNECPRGDTYYTMENRTVTGGTCTAANTSNFVDGESFGAMGVIGLFASGLPRPLTKVASAPGQDQYTVSSSGVYTFGGTAPTQVWINYNATPGGSRTLASEAVRVINEFCNSSAPNFVSTINSVDYGIPGLQYQRPWVRVVDTWNALQDDSTGRPKPGTFDNLQLHPFSYGTYLSSKAIAAKLRADYGGVLPDNSTAPTRNNWYAARGTGAGTTFTGTLPPTMRTGFTTTAAPTLIAINGAVVGAVNTSTGAITGPNITEGTLNFATGVWSITFNAATVMPANAQLWFEQDIGNGVLTFTGGVFSSWTEGTIGRNTVNNGLMDSFTAVGTNLTTVNGTSSITGVAATSVPYGWALSNTALNNAIVAGTVEFSLSSGTDANGYPMLIADIQGRHTAQMQPVLGTGTINNFLSRVTAGDQVLSGGFVRHARHPSVGKLYGQGGYTHTFTVGSTVPVSRSSPTGPQNVTSFLSRVLDNGAGIYAVDEQIMRDEGGAWDQYRVAPLLDTTGAALSGPQLNVVLCTAPANVPIAARMGVGRQQVRRRNDVS